MATWKRLFRLGVGRPGVRQAVDWEIEHHLAELVDRLMDEGLSEVEARREAERRFGDLARQRRRIVATDRRRVVMRKRGELLDTVLAGLRQTYRGIRRSPGLSAAVVLTLGLGIGVNAAMFGVVDRLLLSPPDHIVEPDMVRRVFRDGDFFGTRSVIAATTYPDVTDLRTISELSSVGAVAGATQLTMGVGAEAEEVRAVQGTHDFFTTLGVKAQLGRFFDAQDDQLDAALTAVVSHEFWTRALGGDPDVLGRPLELSGHRATVIGVAPAGFTGIDLEPVDVWLPALPMQYLRSGSDRFVTSRTYWWLQAVVRLKDPAQVEAAEAQATALNINNREENHRDPDVRILTAPLMQAHGPRASDESKVARWTAGVSLIVLLIACANVANLLLARGAGRRREVAVRLSLGVSRRRLFWEAALETLTLATLGGVAALALAHWGGGLIRAVLIPDVLWTTSALNPRVLAATAILAVTAGMLAGFGPATQSSRADLTRDLREGGRGASGRRSRVRGTLTVAQATLSAILLVGAGLFIRSVVEVHRVDLGLDADHLIQASLEFQGEEPDEAEATELYRLAMEAVQAIPGVTAATGSDMLFLWGSVEDLTVPGLDSLPVPPGAGPFYYGVTPGYMRTMGLRILQGRPLLATDVSGTPRVAVVNETMARTFWPGQDPLGKCFIRDETDECTTVVGVVEVASRGELESGPLLAYHVPLAQVGQPPAGIYVRTEGDPEARLGEIAAVMRSLSPRVRFARVQSFRELMAPQTRAWTLGAALFTAFGLLALVVAAIGLYSLLAFDVARRTQELGIRVALGAQKKRVLAQVMASGARLAALGVVIGIAASLAAMPHVRGLLFHVEGSQPVILGAVAALLVSVAVVAAGGSHGGAPGRVRALEAPPSRPVTGSSRMLTLQA
ncbi:MAG: ADOP family duplicated permease [Gemmatimonadota bacterium]